MHHPLAHVGGQWYTSATALSWIGIGVAIAIGVAAIIMWRRGFPRRLLVYRIEVTPLVASRRGMPDLKITYEDEPVEKPTLVSLRVASRSRRDIGSLDFDASKPLVFELGVNIRAVLDGTMGQQSSPSDGLKLSDNRVVLAPQKIAWGVLFRLDLLTEGKPHLSFQSPLLNVTVREVDPADPLQLNRYARLGLLLGFFAVLAAVVILARSGSDSHLSPGATVAFWSVVLVAVLGPTWSLSVRLLVRRVAVTRRPRARTGRLWLKRACRRAIVQATCTGMSNSAAIWLPL